MSKLKIPIAISLAFSTTFVSCDAIRRAPDKPVAEDAQRPVVGTILPKPFQQTTLGNLVDTTQLPSLPLIIPFYCDDEYGCDYTFGVAEDTIPLFSNEGDTARVALFVNPGDTLFYQYQDLRIDAFRLVVFRHPLIIVWANDTLTIAPNDTLVVLHHNSEGICTVIFKGRTYDMESYWSDEQIAQTLLSPHSHCWVSVKTTAGRQAWLNEPSECENKSHKEWRIMFHSKHPHEG